MNKKRLTIYLITIYIVLNFSGQSLFPKSLAFFSPNDNIQSKLVNIINKTNHKIKAAVYIITDKVIAESLINAKKRGVEIELITDQSCLTFLGGKIDMLKNNDIEIFVFAPKTKRKRNPLMHNKFAIFEVDKNENRWVWTGSFNWTCSANRINQENVILTNNKKVFAQYHNQFELLKRQCVLKKTGCNKMLQKQSKTNVTCRNTQQNSSVEKIKEIFQQIKKQLQNQLL